MFGKHLLPAILGFILAGLVFYALVTTGVIE